ncbi:unnamed protein product [Amoebophrya sp. A25]|nr:unnamed protein product [Amoebophrya sp. A25]|eukprot:GSA25T00017348001.1
MAAASFGSLAVQQTTGTGFGASSASSIPTTMNTVLPPPSTSTSGLISAITNARKKRRSPTGTFAGTFEKTSPAFATPNTAPAPAVASASDHGKAHQQTISIAAQPVMAEAVTTSSSASSSAISGFGFGFASAAASYNINPPPPAQNLKMKTPSNMPAAVAALVPSTSSRPTFPSSSATSSSTTALVRDRFLPISSSKDRSLVLVVDTREQRAFSATSLFNNSEARSLPLGDFCWVWKKNVGEGQQNQPQQWSSPELQDDLDLQEDQLQVQVQGEDINNDQELLAGFLMERKSVPDLDSSIRDGRYYEQKFRLMRVLPNFLSLFYLVESQRKAFWEAKGITSSTSGPRWGQKPGFGNLAERGLPHTTICAALVHTQFISGIRTCRTQSPSHTQSLLEAISMEIVRCQEEQERNGGGGRATASSRGTGKGTAVPVLQPNNQTAGAQQAPPVGASSASSNAVGGASTSTSASTTSSLLERLRKSKEDREKAETLLLSKNNEFISEQSNSTALQKERKQLGDAATVNLNQPATSSTSSSSSMIVSSHDISYPTFAREAKKTCDLTTRQLFGRQLRHIDGCGEEAVEQLVREFKSWSDLRRRLGTKTDAEWINRLKDNLNNTGPGEQPDEDHSVTCSSALSGNKKARSIRKDIIAKLRLFIT